MTPQKKVCILVFSEIARDGRVLRQVEHARQKYAVDVVAYGPWDPPQGVNYIQLPRPRAASFGVNLLRLATLATAKFNPVLFERTFWREGEHQAARELLRQQQYDLIHANDWMALPVVVSAAQGKETRILFDAHEYTPAQFDQYFTGRHLKSQYYEYILHTYGAYVSAMVTVSEGIADLYRTHFGWNAEVVRNAPMYTEVVYRPSLPASVELVHPGAAIPGRRLEDLIHLMPLLEDRFCLTFILIPSNIKYVQLLRALAERVAPGRIKFEDAVPPGSIVSRLAAYDIGIHMLKAANRNHLYALPNKFFDFVMAGLGVAVFPLPEMSRIVRENGIGVVSANETVRSMAHALNSLDAPQIDEFKHNSLSLARRFNGDVEMAKLMTIYSRLLST